MIVTVISFEKIYKFLTIKLSYLFSANYDKESENKIKQKTEYFHNLKKKVHKAPIQQWY